MTDTMREPSDARVEAAVKALWNYGIIAFDSFEGRKEIVRAVLAAADAVIPPQALPAGYALVPVEPTREMLIAAAATDVGPDADGVHRLEPWLTALWAAMLAASPPPSTERGWIAVSERLPEPDSGEVLVWLTFGRCTFDEWRTHLEDPIGMSTTHVLDMGCMWRDYEFDEITHWMPLPPPPNQQSGTTPAKEQPND